MPIETTDLDPFIEAAKAIWRQRPGSNIVPWDKLGEVGRRLLIDDSKVVVAAYLRAVKELADAN